MFQTPTKLISHLIINRSQSTGIDISFAHFPHYHVPQIFAVYNKLSLPLLHFLIFPTTIGPRS